jgi:hypothetical protein
VSLVRPAQSPSRELARHVMLGISFTSFVALGGCDATPDSPAVAPTAPTALRLKTVPAGAIIVEQGAPLSTFNGVSINHGGYGSALAVDPRDPVHRAVGVAAERLTLPLPGRLTRSFPGRRARGPRGDSSARQLRRYVSTMSGPSAGSG